MKRRKLARIAAAIGGALVILGAGSSVGAQPAPPAETAAPPVADDAKVEAAKKEVQAYNTAYRKMEKEKGLEAALRYFLTPDYKWVDAVGKARTREEWIGLLVKAFAKMDKAQAAADGPPAANNTVTKAEYVMQGNTVIVTEHSDVLTPAPVNSLPSGTDTAAPHYWRTVQIGRIGYRRTPNGLRLQEEAVVAIRSYLDGKLKYQAPVPYLPK